MKLIPSILDISKDKQASILNKLSAYDIIHIDIIGSSFNCGRIKELKEYDFMALKQHKCDVHIMSLESLEMMNTIYNMPNILINTVYIHLEMMPKHTEIRHYVRLQDMLQERLKAQIGLAIDIDTPLTKLPNAMLEYIDNILLMGVKAGYGGQKYDNRCTNKALELRRIGYKGSIIIDGGVSEAMLESLPKGIIDACVSGSYLLKGM